MIAKKNFDHNLYLFFPICKRKEFISTFNNFLYFTYKNMTGGLETVVPNSNAVTRKSITFRSKENTGKCDTFSGNWVWICVRHNCTLLPLGSWEFSFRKYANSLWHMNMYTNSNSWPRNDISPSRTHSGTLAHKYDA